MRFHSQSLTNLRDRLRMRLAALRALSPQPAPGRHSEQGIGRAIVRTWVR